MSLTAYKLSSADPWSLLNPLINGVEGTWDQPGVIPSLDGTIGVKNG